MQVSEAFPSEYLRAADLQGRQVKVVIDHVELREIGDSDKPVLFFEGKDKGVVLNKTNANTIAAVYGDEMDTWSGKPIILFSQMVSFQGRMQPGIRVLIPAQPRRAAPAAKPVPAQQQTVQSEDPGAEMNDEVPF